MSIKEDGSFVIENLYPGEYRVNVMNLPLGMWLKSIRAGDQEALDRGVELTAGSTSSVLITLAAGTGKVAGAVLDSKQQPAPGSVVTLVPEPMKQGRGDLYRVVNADRSGRFTVESIAPGDYKLYAWDDIEPGAHMDPEFLKRYDSDAEKITVQPNNSQQVSLKLIPLIK